MAWYETGTVAVTNGSTTVTGTSTNFLVGAQIGEAFYGPDDRIYEIAAIVSATAITLGSPYLGSNQSGASYKIVPTQSLVADLASSVTDLISDFSDVRDLAGNGKFQDGTQASPGITFEQDQDTGFYRIGANIVGLSTGGVNRLTADASGNVGIGTANPSDLLDVSENGTSAIRLTDSSTPATYAQIIQANGVLTFAADAGNAQGSSNIQFEIDGSEAVRIVDSGNVGIGTSSPASIVGGTDTNPVLSIGGSDSGIAEGDKAGSVSFITNDTSYTATFADGVAAEIAAVGEGNFGSAYGLAFYTGVITGSDRGERVRIDREGNVGIGTTSPAAKLEIGGAGEGIILASPDGTRYEITVANGGTLTVTAV